MEELTPLEQEQTATPAPPQRGVRWVFIGGNGLRAGWGVLIFIAIFLVIAGVVEMLLQHFFPARHASMQEMPPTLGLMAEGAQLLGVVVATAFMARVEGRSLLAYGYQGEARAVRFISGLVYGFVAISLLVLVLWKAGLLAFDGVKLHGADVWKYAAAWGLMFICVAFFEESALRGYLQYTMTRGVGFWWGALLFSFLFGFAHGTNPGETPVGLFSAGAVGMVFCLSLWYTGSLWWAVGFHAAWDWGESYFYGTSDSGLVAQGHLYGEHPVGKLLWSGGATGPEGSLLVLLLILLIALLMWAWWGRRVTSPFAGSGWRPEWSRRTRVSVEEQKAVELG
jgi:uncharacterized protein